MTDALARMPVALSTLAPHLFGSTWSAALIAPMRDSGIVTPRRIAMFLGQCCEETAAFTRFQENLNFTTAERIMEVFGPHFASQAEAEGYTFSARRLANRVYANRMGNGDEDSGDGWTFRGRGLLQLTGRSAYHAFGQAVPRAAGDPDWLATPAGAAYSACWYWTTRGRLNEMADSWDIHGVGMRINGSMIAQPARIRACEIALAVFGETPPAVPALESQADILMDAELKTLNPTPARPV